MSKPRFNVGDRAYYSHLGQSGTVQKIINEGDTTDVRAQGYRYEVSFDHGKSLWSIIDSELAQFAPKKPNEIK